MVRCIVQCARRRMGHAAAVHLRQRRPQHPSRASSHQPRLLDLQRGTGCQNATGCSSAGIQNFKVEDAAAKLEKRGLKLSGVSKEGLKFTDPDGILVQLNAPDYPGYVPGK